jgi:hypothetical protein
MVSIGCSAGWIRVVLGYRAVCRSFAPGGVNHSTAEGRGRLDLGNRRTQTSRDVLELDEGCGASSAGSDVRAHDGFLSREGQVECVRDE